MVALTFNISSHHSFNLDSISVESRSVLALLMINDGDVARIEVKILFQNFFSTCQGQKHITANGSYLLMPFRSNFGIGIGLLPNEE